MKVVYVLPGAALAGGIKVIGEHVTGLAARGHAAEVWQLGGSWEWFGRPVPHRVFGHTDHLGAALQGFRGVKVATFWTTASWVAPNLLPGERGFYLVQDLDQRTYSGDDSGTSYRLGLTAVTESDSVQEDLRRSYGVEGVNVGIGIDHRTFRPLPMIRDKLRILTPARTTSAGPAGLKGWDLAVAALKLLAAREPRASLVTFGVEDVRPVGFMPHVHVRRPSDLKLRELYSQSGVFLSASRHEGFGLPMLEAMACGLPVVATDSGGNREFCRHEDTALVCRQRTAGGLAAHLARVLADERLAARLSAAGLAEADRYRWPAVVDRLERVYGLARGAAAA